MVFPAMLVALIAGMLAEIWNPPPHRRWPLVTLAVAGLILVTFTLQNATPDLLALLARDPRMLHAGELWRAVTALFAQDGGGVPGMLFNLFWLLVLGTTAERRFSRKGWLAIYFVGGIVTEFLALAWQPHGAGNSIACFALAGALCSDWREGRMRWWRAGVGLIGGVAAAVLLLENDIHGIGFIAGLLIGLVLIARAGVVHVEEAGQANDNVVYIDGGDTLH